METGVSGADGARALKHANRGNNQENVNVIHQLHSTVERNVTERHKKVKCATTKSLVQVR